MECTGFCCPEIGPGVSNLRCYLHGGSQMGHANRNLSRACVVSRSFLQLFSWHFFSSIMWEVCFYRKSLFNSFVEKNNSHCDPYFSCLPLFAFGNSHFENPKDDFQALLHEMLGSCPPPCTNEPHFQAVDGAIGRVCRGLTPEDNANTYFTVRIANSTEQCKQLCRDYPGCKGPEVWDEIVRKWPVKNEKNINTFKNDENLETLFISRISWMYPHMYRCMHNYQHLFGNVLLAP